MADPYVRVDEPGITIVSRPAGRPGEKLEHGDALFSRKYGQATAVVMFDRVFVPWERVSYAGDWEHSQALTYSYATHHRHSCIAASIYAVRDEHSGPIVRCAAGQPPPRPTTIAFGRRASSRI